MFNVLHKNDIKSASKERKSKEKSKERDKELSILFYKITRTEKIKHVYLEFRKPHAEDI